MYKPAAISALPFNPPDNINNNIYNKGGLPIADVNNYPYNNVLTDKEKKKIFKKDSVIYVVPNYQKLV